MSFQQNMDTGFLLLKEKQEIYSPVGMLNYSFYSDLKEVLARLEGESENIQCVVSIDQQISSIAPGESQQTLLWDYADGIDTMKWLHGLNHPTQ